MAGLNVKEAVRIAKDFVAEVMEGEEPTNIGLEEVVYSDQDHTWNVTIGFSRPWNTARGPLSTITGEQASKRAYRVVKINDLTHAPIALTRREIFE